MSEFGIGVILLGSALGYVILSQKFQKKTGDQRVTTGPTPNNKDPVAAPTTITKAGAAPVNSPGNTRIPMDVKSTTATATVQSVTSFGSLLGNVDVLNPNRAPAPNVPAPIIGSRINAAPPTPHPGSVKPVGTSMISGIQKPSHNSRDSITSLLQPLSRGGLPPILPVAGMLQARQQNKNQTSFSGSLFNATRSRDTGIHARYPLPDDYTLGDRHDVFTPPVATPSPFPVANTSSILGTQARSKVEVDVTKPNSRISASARRF
jgi:hypothetical protein